MRTRITVTDLRAAADYCAQCDTVHPAPSDHCPVTGDTYGLPA